MDPNLRKKTPRLLSNGVSNITSRDWDSFGAATVTWVPQASLQPPLLMAAIRKNSSAFRCMAPSLEPVSTWLERQVQQITDDGVDHDIVVSKVVNAQCREPIEPVTIAQSPWEYGG